MNRTRKIFAVILAAALIFGIFATGCRKSDDGEELAAALKKNDDLATEIESLKAQLEDAANVTPAPTSEPERSEFVIGLNALLYPVGGASADADSVVYFNDQISVVAIPQVPIGKVLDYWRWNGRWSDNNSLSAAFTVKGNSVLEAVLRDELKVTAINATLQFLDDKGHPTGEKFTECIFEDDDDGVRDGLISVYVEAVVPANYYVSHWLINNVPYYFAKTIRSFTVYDLDETTVYEPVFKKLDPTPTPTPTPVETVTVSCTNCTFTGGGLTNATNGSVPNGTTITVTGTTDLGNPVVWLINGVTDADTMGRTSLTRTVNSNTTFRYTGYN